MTKTMNADIYHVYVGTYGDEQDEAIQLLEFNAIDGTLKKLASATGIINPSYLTVNQKQNRLYAVSEVEKGEVVSIEMDLSTFKMSEMNRSGTKGSAPCYLTLDQKEEHLFTVNYGEGTMTTHPIGKDGSLGALSDLKTYVGDQHSHPHTVVAIPDTNKYIVSDLGLSKLYLYEFDNEDSKLVFIKEIDAVAGSGPRHIAIEPKLRKVYVVNELNSKVSVYSYDEKVEEFELIQEIGTLPRGYVGENHCADIHIAYEKSYLYASNRGHHSIAVFKIRQDGRLEAITHVSAAGKWPRSFAVLPDEKHMLVANQHTSSIVIMEIGSDGIPRTTGREYRIKAPVCLRIAPRR